MLDFMRKQSETWLIKVVFALIILSFILFFGYSQIQKGRGGGKGVIAVVNGEAVLPGEFKIAMGNALQFMKNIYGDKIPDGMDEQVKSIAMGNLINQVLLAQLAKKFGIAVSDLELYEAISKDPNFQKDGKFNPDAYKHEFLPYFERRYGINYEAFLKKILMTSKLRAFLASQIIISESDAKDDFTAKKTFWDFDRIEIPETPAKDAKYDKAAGEIAREVNEALKSASDKDINRMIKKYGLKKESLKDINIIDGKMRLMAAPEENNSFFTGIFSLTKEKPVLAEPVKAGAKWYAFRLTGFKAASNEEWEKEKEKYTGELVRQRQQNYPNEWLNYMRETAKIKDYTSGAAENE